MKSLRKLYFSELFFYPEGWSGARISTDIVCNLQKNNLLVNVICSSSNYVKPESNQNIINPEKIGVKIKRVGVIFQEKNNFLTKTINDLYFCTKALLFFIKSKDPSLFVCQTNPPFIIPTIYLASLLRKTPYIIIAMDLYPEVLKSHFRNKLNPFFEKFLNIIFNHSYQKAQRVVSLGPYMSEKIRAKGVRKEKIKIIPNWATGNIENLGNSHNPLVSKFNVSNTFTIVYSGTLGFAHDWETIIKAVEITNSKKYNFKLLFISQGSNIEIARNYVLSKKLSGKIKFHNLLPENLINQSMQLTSLAVLTLRSDFKGLVVPSKFSGYLARGVPVLYIGPESEISMHIKKANCGFCFKNNEFLKISNCIISSINNKNFLKKLGLNGKKYYEKFLSKESGCESYLNLINELIQ